MSDASLQKEQRQKLRDKYAVSGIENMSESEILELFLSYAAPNADSKAVASNLLSHFNGNLSLIFNSDTFELCKVDGITKNASALITLVNDIKTRIYRDRNAKIKKLDDTETAKEYVKNILCNYNVERVIIVMLDKNNRILDTVFVAEGTVNHADLEFLKLTKHALGENVDSIVIAHNHPGGNPAPSRDDCLFTKTIIEYFEKFDIKIRDHIIVGKNEVFSIREHKNYKLNFR